MSTKQPLPAEISSLSFSVFTRYMAVAQALGSIRSQNSLKILEVGGRGNYLRRFLPNDDITVLDVIDSDEPNYVKGDGRKLPFKARQFDVVLSTDVLEHIQPNDRTKFIEEQLRVAKTAVIISGPVWSDRVVKTEKAVNDYYQSATGVNHPWLTEHIEYGLPKKALIEQLLSKRKLPFSVRHNQSLELWEEMVMVDMAVAMFGTPKIMAAFTRISKVYNQHIFEYDNGNDGYRAIYTAMVNRQQPPLAPKYKTLAELPSSRLLKLMLAITGMLRLIETHHQTMLRHAQKRGEAVEQLSVELGSLRKQYRQSEDHINNLTAQNQHFAGRLSKIEATLAYRVWKKYLRLFKAG